MDIFCPLVDDFRRAAPPPTRKSVRAGRKFKRSLSAHDFLFVYLVAWLVWVGFVLFCTCPRLGTCHTMVDNKHVYLSPGHLKIMMCMIKSSSCPSATELKKTQALTALTGSPLCKQRWAERESRAAENHSVCAHLTQESHPAALGLIFSPRSISPCYGVSARVKQGTAIRGAYPQAFGARQVGGDQHARQTKPFPKRTSPILWLSLVGRGRRATNV